MKLGIISSMAASSWGGSEELWVALAKHVLAGGDNVSVSIFNWGKLPSKIKKLEKAGAKIHLRTRISYPDLKGKLKGKLTQIILAQKQLQSFIDHENPDVIFVSLGAFCDFEIDSLRKFLLKVNIPFYAVVHSNTETHTINFLKHESIRSVCAKAVKIFFVSERIKKQSERQIAYNFKNSLNVINPVNIENIEVVAYPKTRIINMACVGAIQVGVKGQSMLLQILGSEKWKLRDWKLNIYGRGNDEGLLMELISFYGLNHKVFLQGYASKIRDEIWAVNHVLLMPSFIEGMPIALVEAMLCGRTAVVTDVGGNREILDDNVSGFISEGATPFSFEKALDRAWSQKKEWESMGEVAHKKAFAFYQADPINALWFLLKNNLNNR